jgi:hypothetical protein
VLIAFDLDDTLVPCGATFETAPPPWPMSLLCNEPLRVGAPELLRRLRRAEHHVAVYTTSARSRVAIHLNFFAYGITLKQVVTEPVHEREVRRGRRLACLKYPPHFGVDWLVDDSPAVVQEGRRLGYRVVLVNPDEEAWTETVLRAVGGRARG